MKIVRKSRSCLAGALLLATASISHGEQPASVMAARIADTGTSHAFLAAAHLRRPLDLAAHGYVEEEFLVSGDGRVFDWPAAASQPPRELAKGPYTTRILVRRPSGTRRFSGTVILEPMNPSSPVDLAIMWAESYEHFIAQGHAWVGITIKPNTIKALKTFDPERYAAVSMAVPGGETRCGVNRINASSQPTTTAEEAGLAWDMISQIGALLKGATTSNPLGIAARRLYLTGQSQTAGYARTYATVFHAHTQGPDGKPLVDGYLYSGSPPWQVPLHQCREDLLAGDPRLITPAVGVPVIELFAQGDIGTNLVTRRPDSDTPRDRYRRYEIAGAPHVDPWEQQSTASAADLARATRGASPASDSGCKPTDVAPSDFPTRIAFNAAWRNLDQWVQRGIVPPKAPLLQVKPGVTGAAFDPETAFVTDEFGNAKGGVRTPTIDVPTARWVGAKTGSFRCMFEGYKYPFDAARLKALYPTPADYGAKLRRSVERLQKDRWLLEADGAALLREAPAR